MPTYVALLRGIMPTNPNLRNHKLQQVFENLGFTNVQTVIASGNIVFVTPVKDTKKLETTIEKAIAQRLGFTSTTIIRSQEQLHALVDQDPFKGLVDSHSSRLNVTFLKNPPKTKLQLLHRPDGKSYEIIGMYDGTLCSVIDLDTGKTPDLMSWLEKQFGKDITTRTWKTVGRILKKCHTDSKT